MADDHRAVEIAQRDPVVWALAIQAEWERATAADDEFRDENVTEACHG